jgi:hypothetical protein
MRVRAPHHFLQVLKGHVRGELGAGDLRVAQDGLDVSSIGVIVKYGSGHGVTEGMGRHRL